MSTQTQMINSYKQHPNRWNLIKGLIEPGREKYKGGTSTYANLVKKWTGSKLGIHKIVRAGRFIHGPHIHPFI